MAILYAITNKSKQKQNLKIICPTNYIQCDNNDYFDKPYHLELSIFKNNNTKLNKELNKILKPNETFIFYLSIRCLYNDEIVNNTNKLVANALLNRKLYNIKMNQCCFLKLGNLELETMYYFSKIHSVEAIFLTKNGYMHSPCGGQYYAATWTNDQCEYAFPFFSYLPYNLVTKTMINCFKQYEKYMYTDKPLVSSIIAEATSFWNGANDRGDSAMYAYGLTRFLLTYGQKSLAKAFIKPLKWCLDYTLNKTNQDGVIESDTDELENRFESGKANLATNAIFYQALVKANILFNELNIKNNYDVLANNLKENINKYFYKEQKCLYCKEEKNQRTHIVYPLIMGIYDHKDDIINTLLNNNLYTDFGFKVSDNEDVYWDRITLMAIRGLFNADEADLAYKILEKYTNNRLLNDHVPYAIEAYPEGNQAHLAAESALYARIFIEGMLGFEPYGFKKFKLHLSLPNKIKKLYLKNFLYNKHLLSIYISRNKNIIKIKIPELNLNKQISNHQDFIINI